MARFTIGRSDGRSNQQVIIDLVKSNDKPGTIFSYGELANLLNAGATRTFGQRDVQIIVRQAIRRLGKESKRTLQNIRGVGYRIAYATDHLSLALIKEDKADRQMRAGLNLLENVRLDEMDENHRLAHQGTWMLMSAMYSQTRSLMRRQRATEIAIEQLKARATG